MYRFLSGSACLGLPTFGTIRNLLEEGFGGLFGFKQGILCMFVLAALHLLPCVFAYTCLRVAAPLWFTYFFRHAQFIQSFELMIMYLSMVQIMYGLA